MVKAIAGKALSSNPRTLVKASRCGTTCNACLGRQRQDPESKLVSKTSHVSEFCVQPRVPASASKVKAGQDVSNISLGTPHTCTCTHVCKLAHTTEKMYIRYTTHTQMEKRK